MPKASVTRQIASEKQKLIDFVLDIEKYPEFIPFCINSKVYEKNDNEDQIAIIADLTIGKKPFVDTYKSDVRYYKKNDSIHVTNIGGPLKHLENNWKFIQKENYTEVQFDVDFEIKNKFLNMIMTKSFQFGLNKIADAFQKRAENL
jgi:coenzyme Q-binding protein COQ10